MHDQHDVMLAIGRLEGKLDSLISSRVQEQQEIKLLESRVREVEHAKATLLGMAAAAGGGASALITIGLHILSLIK